MRPKTVRRTQDAGDGTVFLAMQDPSGAWSPHGRP